MTREEAKHALSQLRGTEIRQKEILLEMHIRNAHKSMGYKTWPEFADKELGVGKSRFYELLEAAKTERALSTFVDDSNQMSTISVRKFSDDMLLELAKLKDPAKITAAAQEAIAAAPTMSYRGKESRFNGQLRTPLVKNIVNRMLSAPQKPLTSNTAAAPDKTPAGVPRLPSFSCAPVLLPMPQNSLSSPRTARSDGFPYS